MIYALDHKVPFARFNGVLEKDGIKYYPDFVLSDNKTIIEIKGFEDQASVDKKTLLAESFGYHVTVLRKDDLYSAFDYVQKKYQTSRYYELYDDYKSKYNYFCSHCNKKFHRETKSKTDIVFCCRSCAGKGHKGRKLVPIDYVG